MKIRKPSAIIGNWLGSGSNSKKQLSDKVKIGVKTQCSYDGHPLHIPTRIKDADEPSKEGTGYPICLDMHTTNNHKWMFDEVLRFSTLGGEALYHCESCGEVKRVII